MHTVPCYGDSQPAVALTTAVSYTEFHRTKSVINLHCHLLPLEVCVKMKPRKSNWSFLSFWLLYTGLIPFIVYRFSGGWIIICSFVLIAAIGIVICFLIFAAVIRKSDRFLD